MKQWITAIAVSLFSITLLTGCGDAPPAESDVKAVATPEDAVKEVVTSMFEAFKDQDYDAIAECLTPDQAEEITAMKGMLAMMPAEELEKQKAMMAKAIITIGEIKITGDTATCETTVSGLGDGDKPETDTVDLKKVDGKWYIADM